MKAQQDQLGALSQDVYEAGNFVFADQYVVNTQGRLLSGYGQEAPHNQVHCFMMMLLALSGLKIKSFLDLIKL